MPLGEHCVLLGAVHRQETENGFLKVDKCHPEEPLFGAEGSRSRLV